MVSLWIKDMTTGEVHEYGSNGHDSLVSFDGGKTLTFENLQNGYGSLDDNGYRFVHEDGTPLNFDDCGSETADVGGCGVRKTGHWIGVTPGHGSGYIKYMCSECKTTNGKHTTDFCPHCGADMRESLS